MNESGDDLPSGAGLSRPGNPTNWKIHYGLGKTAEYASFFLDRAMENSTGFCLGITRLIHKDWMLSNGFWEMLGGFCFQPGFCLRDRRRIFTEMCRHNRYDVRAINILV